jgi:hypothetical protein
MSYFFDGTLYIDAPQETLNEVRQNIKNILNSLGLSISIIVDIDAWFNGIVVVIRSSWRNYDSELQNFCCQLVELYPTIKGRIEARGEDIDDRWAVEIQDGKVFEVSYILQEHKEVYTC